MRAFSKRYKSTFTTIQKLAKLGDIKTYDEQSNEFLHEKFRNRLAHVIKYITSQDGYVENFLRIHDKEKGLYFIHDVSLKDLSEAELGYDITQYFDTKSLKFRYTGSFDEDPEYHDFALRYLLC